MRTNRLVAVDVASVEDRSLDRVALAVSTYRSDDKVIALLRQLFGGGGSPFTSVIVVDSLTSGAIEREIAANDWPVLFWSADRNLGSAGNLKKRMELAAGLDAEWCYTINADGGVDLDMIRTLVRVGDQGERVGAVYPTRFRPNRGDSWEPPRTSLLPLSAPIGLARRQAGNQDVLWSSSNGALYHLGPPRAGIFVWDDFWMGWDELSYGWQLSSNGWNQILCGDAVFSDDYEHRKVNFLGRTLYVHDKAPWMSYYTIRNLALFVQRSDSGLEGWGVVARRYLQEAVLATLYKRDKARRIALLTRGLLDGLRGRSGMFGKPLR